MKKIVLQLQVVIGLGLYADKWASSGGGWGGGGGGDGGVSP